MRWDELAKHFCSMPRTLAIAIFPQTTGKRKPPTRERWGFNFE